MLFANISTAIAPDIRLVDTHCSVYLLKSYNFYTHHKVIFIKKSL